MDGYSQLRLKLAALPAKFWQSKEGRKLAAKVLWQVRKAEGKARAKEVRTDILMFSCF